ncbi:CO/xanthine dehydrogenase FAD-binding subunit [Jatrophihabitans sp. GAS493]|uniref:FAD binding domain-containing protein n=1 Tax=Jatrophihabitans sp. GAS493 TaxID=1907575 RepID=UPI000BB92750|nr:FAD binding domain-containing protein [Jatrophihabitans sp. GAS493]SOD71129.1 CO/xanthine dehydrogenase FAD-binding subunit [Jatrophihabitans sp. GAS493]
MDLTGVTALADATDRRPQAEWRPGDRWLAGGTWLFSEPQPGVQRLFDLAAFGWSPLQLGENGLEIAATCTIADLARLQLAPQYRAAPLLLQCCQALLGSFKIWNVATVGGNICMSLPAGPMTSLAAALDGVCLIWSADGGSREVPVADFVTGPNQNVLSAGDLLRSVTLPAEALRGRTAFRQISLNNLGRSAALVIGRRDGDGSLQITVTAATTRPVRLRFATIPTDAQLGQTLKACGAVYYDDVHGAPEWRRAMTATFCREVRDELRDD